MKIPVSLLKNPVHLLSVGFGSGLAPKAPGTFGTIAALPFWYVLQFLPPAYYVVVLILAFILGVYLCGATADALGVHDHGGIVWDEFVGLWIALFMVPMHLGWILLGFALFRLFDIWKPWPIRVLDAKVHGGFGIMIDDVLAGVYAYLTLQLLYVLS
ncbi:phosphatidylglycerophosphatase [gamma proteobacterium BDW918]|jgi:phosphatidylglycerophosphatase A|uniref:Phosphatidylglycerophosphatase A n=1 Tax=Zhongshania aliphaticivorans TaxID=1470434 RepID=A0A127M9L1_9GAMM|nr:phosphatidylglycerophosphatase A [Zhongshania aliphaticivorans]AMO69865.1 phosphatidylglycerophosphatase [Zhongshania aliphaticivorans]EIF41986.1 phosphatidylglycerophosphatase [gamma proteobacterium BDW918]